MSTADLFDTAPRAHPAAPSPIASRIVNVAGRTFNLERGDQLTLAAAHIAQLPTPDARAAAFAQLPPGFREQAQIMAARARPAP